MAGTENEFAEMVVGSRGWEHPQWLDSYYPDDLPEDWRLGYYANEFGCVLLPPEVWGAANEATVEQWLDDVEEGFLFFLELPARPMATAGGLAAFAGRCAGAILSEGEPADWQAVLDDIPLLQSEDTGGLRCYHRAGQTETVLAWLNADAGEKIALPVLREQIEASLQGVAKTSRLAFIIGNGPPAVENLQNAMVVAELLGA
ncbi:hypothetical protein [Sulfuriflexus mobilis]|uniref:hypothetical protein n=1 Tax=Sulfuriflexus mobilis TaxID=1811807 RepID=UPI001559324B|nr:hypothetical protein [Sulfuriflexus mobilis]